MLLSINKKYPPEIGGVEIVAEEVAEIGFDVFESSEVITFNSIFRNKVEKVNNVNITRIKSISLNRSVRIPFGYNKTMKKKVESADKIVFHFPSFVPEFILVNCKAEKICLYHADVVEKGFIGDIYNKIVVKRFLNSMDKIIVTSPNMVKTSTILKGRNNISVIPLGIDVGHFKTEGLDFKNQIIEDFNGHKNDKIVLSVGRLARYKGIDVLLKAVSMLPEKYRLVLVSNDSQDQIKKEIDKLKISSRVKFYKGVKYEDLPKYYRAADVFCMPSTDRGEAFGLVAVEAMACGTPVITTELGTGTSYHNMDRITGRVIEKNNPSHLKDAILEICNNKNTYNCRVIRDRAEDFSLDKFKENWSSLLKR